MLRKCQSNFNDCVDTLLQNYDKLIEISKEQFGDKSSTNDKSSSNNNDSDNNGKPSVTKNGKQKLTPNGKKGNKMNGSNNNNDKNKGKNKDKNNNNSDGESDDDKDDRECAQKYKLKGNEFVKNKEYQNAIVKYTKAINRLENSKKINIDNNDKKNIAIYYSNRAMCYWKLNKFEIAINDCSQSITYDKSYIKSYWRRAQCYESINDYKRAILDYQKMKQIAININSEQSINVAKNGIKRNKEKL